MTLRSMDFESIASAIPPPEHKELHHYRKLWDIFQWPREVIFNLHFPGSFTYSDGSVSDNRNGGGEAWQNKWWLP